MGTPPAGIPEADGLATSDASAVATNAVASRALPGRGGSCCRCGSLLEGEDPDPLRHQVIEHRFSSLVDLLGSAYPLSFNKTQALLNQLLEVEISRGEIATIRQRISAVLTTRWPTSNSPTGQRGWQWLMVSRVNRFTGLGSSLVSAWNGSRAWILTMSVAWSTSRSTAATAMEPLGNLHAFLFQ